MKTFYQNPAPFRSKMSLITTVGPDELDLLMEHLHITERSACVRTCRAMYQAWQRYLQAKPIGGDIIERTGPNTVQFRSKSWQGLGFPPPGKQEVLSRWSLPPFSHLKDAGYTIEVYNVWAHTAIKQADAFFVLQEKGGAARGLARVDLNRAANKLANHVLTQKRTVDLWDAPELGDKVVLRGDRLKKLIHVYAPHYKIMVKERKEHEEHRKRSVELDRKRKVLEAQLHEVESAIRREGASTSNWQGMSLEYPPRFIVSVGSVSGSDRSQRRRFS